MSRIGVSSGSLATRPLHPAAIVGRVLCRISGPPARLNPSSLSASQVQKFTISAVFLLQNARGNTIRAGNPCGAGG